MWFPVTGLPPVSYSPVGAQTYPKLDLYAFYSYFQVNSCQMTSLQAHFRSCEVMWCHFLPRDSHLVRVSHVGAQMYPNLTYRPSTATSRWLSVKLRHFRDTSGHVTSFPVTWMPPPVSSSPAGAQTYPKLDL